MRKNHRPSVLMYNAQKTTGSEQKVRRDTAGGPRQRPNRDSRRNMGRKHAPTCLHWSHRCVGSEALLKGEHGRDNVEYGST